MVKIDDHKDAKGEVDWQAYERAQVVEGEKCSRCGAFILFPKGFMMECNDCKALDQDHGEVSHDDFLRCPRCGKTEYVHDSDSYEFFADDTHSVCCTECDYEYEITTHVSYTFTSPERLKGHHKCDHCDEWYEGERPDEYSGLCPKCKDKNESDDQPGDLEGNP